MYGEYTNGFVQKVKAAHCLDEFVRLNPRRAPQTSDRPARAASRRVRRLTRKLTRA
jgi:hypothetical protein